jgi:hypothetical protein
MGSGRGDLLAARVHPCRAGWCRVSRANEKNRLRKIVGACCHTVVALSPAAKSPKPARPPAPIYAVSSLRRRRFQWHGEPFAVLKLPSLVPETVEAPPRDVGNRDTHGKGFCGPGGRILDLIGCRGNRVLKDDCHASHLAVRTEPTHDLPACAATQPSSVTTGGSPGSRASRFGKRNRGTFAQLRRHLRRARQAKAETS